MVAYACIVCGRISNTRRCKQHGASNQRPGRWQRGYQTEYDHNRIALLAAKPPCVDCGQPATVADHDPPRRTLVARGVPNPDGKEWLVPRCRNCHRIKTAQGR